METGVHAVSEALPTPEDAAPQSALTLSKRKEKKAQKVTKKCKPVPGSADVRVQHTNDDSVVSKRSAVSAGYLADPYLRHFVAKPSRRAPLINRGYYLRMVVMTDLVMRAVNACVSASGLPPSRVQVISLGAGYDTFAFRTLLGVRDGSAGASGAHARGPPLTPLAATASKSGCLQFFDVDFPAVMQNKAALMAAAPAGTFNLPELVVCPSCESLPVRSAQYHAIGLDLREAQERLLPSLEATASTTAFSRHHPTIIYAECVMQYMPAAAARELIACVARTFTDAVFISYDQLCPGDSFGRVMVSSLKQKGSPLLGIDVCPDGPAMRRRAREAGMVNAYFADFYQLARFHIDATEEARLRALEAFDELEEWAEMCEHYGITLAFTSHTAHERCVASEVDSGAGASQMSVLGNPAFTSSEAGNGHDDTDPDTKSHAPPLVATLQPWPSARFGFAGWGCGEVFAEVHPTDPHERLIVSFGGFALVGKSGQRVSTVRVHAMREGELRVVVPSTEAAAKGLPPATVFHSFSRLRPFTYVVVGGRTNPDTATADAYLLQLSPQPTTGGVGTVVARWSTLSPSGPQASPPARFRHAAAGLAGDRVLVVGGRGVSAETADRYLNDAWVGLVNVEACSIAWSALTFGASPPLPAVCSATLTAIDDSQERLLLAGGLMADGHCSNDARVLDLRGSATAEPVGELTSSGALARFSHSVTRLTVNGRDHLLVFGGCSSRVKAEQMPAMAVLVDVALREAPVAVELPADCPRGLAGHALVSVARGTVAVVGGGYTCFSFGTFLSRPLLLELGDEAEAMPPWRRPATRTEPLEDGVSVADAEGRPEGMEETTMRMGQLLSKPWRPVEERSYSPAAFVDVAMSATRPVVFRGVPLGPCVERWSDAAYLKGIEPDAVVSVHVANNHGTQALDFVRKNFTFRHVPFPELVAHVEDSVAYHKDHGAPPADRETWYLRSVAASMRTERANLWADFRNLGADFELPPGAREHVMPRLHQSCLRLNAAPLQLWTHYDTYDNILCQIVGRKRVVLFPPSEYGNLYMSGSSSPVLHIDNPNLLQYPRFVDACKRAVEVLLCPGDVLYFPANWFHHITTLMDEPADTYSVSVNLFFEHFARDVYDKRDLYGNKDVPAVVELRQEITARVREAVSRQRLTREPGSAELPKAYAHFALRQALQDLEKLADELHLETGA